MKAGAEEALREEIATHGPLRFPRFMETALYHPQGGYYSTPGRRIGREGDFFTSVSAGPVFGWLLARHIAACAPPGPFRILELGAHDGTLLLDILTALRRDFPDVVGRVRPAILEPLPALAARQRETLAGHEVEIHAGPSGLAPSPGFLVANELIDALPCHLLESDGVGWQEIGVGLDRRGRFEWVRLGPAGRLAAGLPERAAGYRTEVRPDLADFLRPLVPLVSGMLFIDYGFERRDFLDPARRDGTLRTYGRHRAGDDPLAEPGRLDITAHVDFSALREALESLGGRVLRFENQSRFLTRVAEPWLRGLEGRSDNATRKLLRNFQTLTHPGQLGGRFHVMEAEFPVQA